MTAPVVIEGERLVSRKYDARRGSSFWTSRQGRDPESILISNGV
jgi:hypothetical protein